MREDVSVVSRALDIDDPEMLRVLEAVAAEKARNLELKRERERLKRRIAEEDARLAHA